MSSHILEGIHNNLIRNKTKYIIFYVRHQTATEKLIIHSTLQIGL